MADTRILNYTLRLRTTGQYNHIFIDKELTIKLMAKLADYARNDKAIQAPSFHYGGLVLFARNRFSKGR